MTLPRWVDFEFSERTAAVMARRLSGSSAAWGRLFANAQAVLSTRTDTRDSESESSYDFKEWRDLVAAARVLDLAATEFGVSDIQNRKNAAILAACAFGMSGTAVSASAVIENHKLLDNELTPGELTALALSSPNLCRSLYQRLPERTRHRNCLENIVVFLVTGRDEQLEIASEELDRAIWEEDSPWEGYLLRLSRLALSHIGRLAVARVLGTDQSRFPDGYVSRLASDSPMLLPSQYEAISGFGVFDSERNLLISLPTGTGKTLLGELALMSSLGNEPGLACYIAPYVALGRQVADKIRRHTPPEVRVHQLVGGYREPDDIDPENYPEVIVATPERFDALLRLRGDLLSSIRCVVFDEAHIVGNSQRGIRVEGLITRLRLAAQRGDRVPKFLLLSAVLSNTDAIATWIGISPTDVVSGTWRPSAKRLLRWTQDGALKLHAGDDPLRSNPSEVLGETNLPWPQVDFYQAHHYGSIRQQEPRALENTAYLADFEYKQFQQPVLCICSTRSKTRRLATQAAERFPVIDPLPQPIMGIINLIDQKYAYLRPLREALRRGVAYHNSSLPHDLRESIERAVETRALKVVAATTTLAEGVDLPFRVTILADWLTFDGENDQPMESLLFKNIAGRCGRAGQFTEGDTVVFDNPVGDPRLTSPFAARQVLQDNIFFAETLPILTSAISRVSPQVAVSAVGSQLLAAIPENPSTLDLASTFHELSFAFQTEGTGVAATRIKAAIGEILDDTDGQALAVISSPATLTPFGRAASSSGLSPKTAKRLRTALNELTDKGASRKDLIDIGTALLRSLGDADEQVNPDLRKAVTNRKSRPIVRLNSLDLVIDLWISGKSYEAIFPDIPSNQRSRRQPRLQEWLAGVLEDSTWIEEFAKFHDFMSNCIEFFLPWLFRAARPLEEIDEHPERPWLEWSRFVELGVDNNWAVRMLDDNVIQEREAARTVGKHLDTKSSQGELSTGDVQQILREVLGEDNQTISVVLDWFHQLDRSQLSSP